MKKAAADNETDLLKTSNVLKPTSKAYVTKRVTGVKTPHNFFPSGCVSFRL
jgi:hypothetical protein